MHKSIALLPGFFFLLCQCAKAQYQKSNAIPVYENGQALQLPWAGGTNAASFNTMDLNSDGLKDLVVFERQYPDWDGIPGVFRLTTYLNAGFTGQTKYLFAPQYQAGFPVTQLRNFIILKDYDCDGYEDIFSYSQVSGTSGISVFHCDSVTANGPWFSLKNPLLYATYFGSQYLNLQNAGINQPLITDINFDGDIDIAVFQISGNQLEYFENQSMENWGICDSLVFEQNSNCWGKIALRPDANVATLNNFCIPYFAPVDSAERQLHSGACMLPFDDNGDSDWDIINGDILGQNLLYLQNDSDGIGHMSYQDSLFPKYDVPVDYITFPAPYYFDADNDGANDLIVSSCSVGEGAENFNNNLFYKNTTNNTTNQFSYIKTRFLTDQMIDVGSGALVAFNDIDNDGLTDLLAGNFGYLNTQPTGPDFYSGVAYYRNTGTVNCPQFTLQTRDFSGIQALNLKGICPAFGDIDGDLDNDMLLGETDGKLYLYLNNSGTFSLAPNGIQYQNIDVGNCSTPQIIDYNNDGLKDLLIGNAFGNIYYYQNNGPVSNPVFSFVTNTFGKINVTQTQLGATFGYSQPLLYNDNGNIKLAVGSAYGQIFLYDSITQNPNDSFHLASPNAFNIYEPSRCTIAMSDINNDGLPEIVIGVYSGGVALYSQYINPQCPATEITDIKQKELFFALYPVPAKDFLILESMQQKPVLRSVEIFNPLGEKISEMQSSHSRMQVDIHSLKSGIYIIRLLEDGNLYTRRFVVN